MDTDKLNLEIGSDRQIIGFSNVSDENRAAQHVWNCVVQKYVSWQRNGGPEKVWYCYLNERLNGSKSTGHTLWTSIVVNFNGKAKLCVDVFKQLNTSNSALRRCFQTANCLQKPQNINCFAVMSTST